MIEKLCLGTAKIGIPNYGYSRTGAIVNVDQFLTDTFSLGIKNLDTSPRYGNCEKIIGNLLKSAKKKPKISTKIDNLFPNSQENIRLMITSIESSIKKLNIETIDICYLHQNELEIISDKYVHKGIETLKKEGYIKEIGTSVYTKSELKYTLESSLYDWVQIPLNILDSSFYNMVLEYDKKIKVSARSIFLQGILLNRKFIFKDIRNHAELLNTLKSIDKLCNKNKLNLQQLSIAYLSQLKKINQIILGTTSINNLLNNISYLNLSLPDDLLDSIKAISEIPKSWTNPRNWSSN